MTEPLHHFGDAFHPQSVGQLRAREHDHGKTERPRGIDLGARTGSPGIAGDDPFDAARFYHLQFSAERERPPRHDDFGIERQCALGWIYKPQRVGMLRPRAEGRDVLPPDGEKHPGTVFWQSRHRGGDIGNLDPVVAGRSGPGWAFERNQLSSGCSTRRNRVAAYLGGEGMRCVNHMGDGLATDVVGKAARAAKAADTGRQWLIGWGAGATAVGIDRVVSRARHLVRKQIGVGGSAQNEGAHHG